MGLLYTASTQALSVTANSSSAQDIFELVNSASCTLRIHQIRLTSLYNVDERIQLQLVTRSTTGSGGSGAVTPNARNPNNTVASKITSFKTLVTTPGTVGLRYEPEQWSQLGPYELLYTPEMRIEVPVSGRLCLLNETAYVASTRTMAVAVTWEEN